MQKSITEILTERTSYTADFTYADTAVAYNEEVVSQSTVNDKLNKILKASNHIARRTPTTLFIVDLLTGSTETALKSHDIKKVETNLNTEIISTFTTKYGYKEFYNGGIDGTPNLVEKESSVSISTGYAGGVDKDTSSGMQATKLSVALEYLLGQYSGIGYDQVTTVTISELCTENVVVGEVYELTFTVSGHTAGALTALSSFQTELSQDGTFPTVNGNGTFKILCTKNTISYGQGLKFSTNSSFVGTVTVNSLKLSNFLVDELIYSQDNLLYILNRNKTLNERKPITVVLKDLFDYNVGEKLTFDTDFETGFVVVTDVKPNDTNFTTTLTGLGEYTRKA